MIESLLRVVISGLLEGSVYSLIGIGLGLIIGVMRIVNYAYGELVIFAAFINYFVFYLIGLDPFLSLIVSVPLTVGLAILLQMFIINPAIAEVEFQTSASMIVTFGLALLISQLEYIVWSPNLKGITTDYTALRIGWGDFTFNLMRVLSLVIAIVAAVMLQYVLNHTVFGKAMRACAQDRDAATLFGINFERIAYLTFGIAAAVAATAGLAYIMTHVMNPSAGISFTIKGFTVLLLGGMGSVYGPLLAGLLIGVVENLGSFYIGGLYRDTITFVLLLFILLARPRGILGRREA